MTAASQPEHLQAGHVDRLAGARIDLARHDRGAGLQGRQDDLVEARVRAGGQQAQIVADLAQVHRQELQGGRKLGQVGQELRGLDPVFRALVDLARERADGPDHERAELAPRIHARADGVAADAQLAQLQARRLDAPRVLLQRARPGPELLAQRDRHGVLQVGSAALEDVGEFPLLPPELLDQPRGGSAASEPPAPPARS